MNDLISREAALERAEACTFTDKNEKRKFMDWLNYCLDAAIEPQWIPCSERLPEDQEDVLITLFGDSIYLGWYDLTDKQWCTEEFDCEEGEVIAWMPLPQPYKAEQT